MCKTNQQISMAFRIVGLHENYCLVNILARCEADLTWNRAADVSSQKMVSA
jgi:hypothetical protein